MRTEGEKKRRHGQGSDEVSNIVSGDDTMQSGIANRGKRVMVSHPCSPSTSDFNFDDTQPAIKREEDDMPLPNFTSQSKPYPRPVVWDQFTLPNNYGNGGSGPALQDYQTQLCLLDLQRKKRLEAEGRGGMKSRESSVATTVFTPESSATPSPEARVYDGMTAAEENAQRALPIRTLACLREEE